MGTAVDTQVTFSVPPPPKQQQSCLEYPGYCTPNQGPASVQYYAPCNRRTEDPWAIMPSSSPGLRCLHGPRSPRCRPAPASNTFRTPTPSSMMMESILAALTVLQRGGQQRSTHNRELRCGRVRGNLKLPVSLHALRQCRVKLGLASIYYQSFGPRPCFEAHTCLPKPHRYQSKLRNLHTAYRAPTTVPTIAGSNLQPHKHQPVANIMAMASHLETALPMEVDAPQASARLPHIPRYALHELW
jgi:hypothetical protein